MMEQMSPKEITIALAEDNPALRKLLVQTLQRLGYRVICAVSNGAELLEFCFDEKVDVVLVDLDMPVVDGLEAAEEVVKKGIPVVLISGLPDARHMVLDQEPVVTRLAKPASPESIKEAIELALASRPGQRP